MRPPFPPVALFLLLISTALHETPSFLTIVQRPSDFCGTDVRGIEYWVQDAMPCSVLNGVEDTLEELVQATEAADGELEGVSLIFTEDFVRCGPAKTVGCTFHTVSVVTRTHPRWQSVLKHELGHHLLKRRGGPWRNGDSKHENSAWWKVVDGNGRY